MKAHRLPIPGIVLGQYPERRGEAGDVRPGGLVPARTFAGAGAKRYRDFAREVEALDSACAHRDPARLEARIKAVRAAMAREGMTDALIVEACALVKRACASALGIELFATQLFAARAMLDQRLAEMATGEGKTIAAAVCAAIAALAGVPVHVITANDYLVSRDARIMRPLYAALGLSVAAVHSTLPAAARRKAYDSDIVYCTASELAFDYLRDRLVRKRATSELHARVENLQLARSDAGSRATLLRGLCMAIVDEADSILIDDARVPLILSERCANTGESRYLADALHIARQLAPGDYALDARTKSARLTACGREAVERMSEGLDGAWHNRIHREETVCIALAALHLFERDRHYLVRDRAVTIIDESTGRLALGRVWSRGLHRLIELKEGCSGADDTVTVAQITYQRFFRRYLALCGMSGTLKEARRELRSTYGLGIVRVPLRCADTRRVLPTRLYRCRDAQWKAVLAEATRLSREGRPVLIGTDSVAESHVLSARLAQENLPHAVLNAAQDGGEAQVIAAAGGAGQITVATNMAGRGTDIALGPGVAERGGLHVISCQHNASRRIDRQLLGRCARRGEPGSAQTLLALDKPLIARWLPSWLAARVTEAGWERPQWLVRLVVRLPQRLAESRERAQRRELLKRDLRAARSLSFGRPME